jgi:hypothetical protein
MSATSTEQSEASPHYYGGLGPGIVGVSWSLFSVATLLLVLRIYTHFRVLKNKGGWALILACVAWVFHPASTNNWAAKN